MTAENPQWQEIKENYLRQIEKSLAQVDYPRRTEIVNNVREHLDNKYAELSPDKQNWEGYQQIITEMGPPEDYADLLTEEKPLAVKKKFGINEFLAVVFVIVLIIVGGYLIYTAKKTPPQMPPAKATEFELDEQVLGQWLTVDFVKTIDDFDPAKKNWQGNLFLLSLNFENNGKVCWKAKRRKEMTLEWTRGKVEPRDKRPSFYYLRNIDGQTYLFYEWVSGDVTIRGREPSFYVLKQVADNEIIIPSWFENDPQAIGFWVSVDFVETIEDFRPEEQKQASELFLKTLLFKYNGKLLWTIGTSKPIGLDWTKGKIRPFDVWPATYSIKQINQTDYLFYEYRTQHSQSAGYYVFKRAPQPEIAEETETEAFEEDRQVLGQWTTVDFVETLDTFRPNQQLWRGNLFVKGLDFKQEGIVEWCLGEDHMKINYRWTKGKLIDEELPAQYIIERYDDGDYLFMEWNSGDVTIRGQKPMYYVLKRAEDK